MDVDVITQTVVQARLDGIVREMQAAVLRTGFSTIIRESHDFSAGITDINGAVIGQFSPLPTHLGAYPDCVRGVLDFYSIEEMQEGDCFLANHPYYSGCPHPNDMVVVLPIFVEGKVIAFCASMGHKADIGGQSPGSRNTIARDVFGDGFQIMPVLFQRDGQFIKEVEHFLRSNSRTPELVIGDLAAQAGALRSIGALRVKALAKEYGASVLLGAIEQIIARIEARVRSHISEWTDGAFEAEALIDDIVDPTKTIKLHVVAIKEKDSLILDFSKSDDQSEGPINVRPPFIRGMAYFAAIAMMDPSVPNNGGLAKAIECKFREGSIVSPSFPAPVGFYSTTMATIEDIVFEAVSKAAGKPPVAHNAPSSMVVLGTSGVGRARYVQYELLRTGNGAFVGGDGYTGTGHSWAGGAKFTSVEILESEFDVELERFALIPDSGGAGSYRGGLGLTRQYRVLKQSKYSGGTARQNDPAHGVNGGYPGAKGVITVNPGQSNEKQYRGLISNLELEQNDIIRIDTGSSGGAGAPASRDPSLIASDLRNGYITPSTALQIYNFSQKDIDEALKVE
mgnify:FL=1